MKNKLKNTPEYRAELELANPSKRTAYDVETQEFFIINYKDCETSPEYNPKALKGSYTADEYNIWKDSINYE